MRTIIRNTNRTLGKKMNKLTKIGLVYAGISTSLIIAKVAEFTDIRWIWILFPIWMWVPLILGLVGFVFAVAAITAAVDTFLERDVSIPLKKWAFS